jgi:energy-coupling factor transport system ATP-binding protein
VLLLGPSGSGKSTLLMAMAGLLDPSGAAEHAGELRVDGRPPGEVRDRIGIVFQDPESQIVMGRAGDDVAFGLENLCLPAAAIWPRVGAALEAVGFGYPPDRPTDALSGGEQQRLVLAGTLAMRPGLLLLDEPTANLDPDGAAAVREVLTGIARSGSMTMVLVEHRVGDALALVDRVVALDAGGGLLADGAPREVFRRHGTALAEAGVWTPDGRLPPPPARRRGPAQSQLVADQASYTYPGSGVPALRRTDVQVRSAEALAITGPNGSGKSTLALLLAGLLRPTVGEVYATEALATGRGHDAVWRWPARDLVSHVGMVFQDPEHQFLAGTTRDELALGPIRAGVPHEAARRRADELLERLHLDHLAEANPFTLSGGEKRRLSVATALATAPEVVILDEPTFGQDRRTATELLHLLAALRDEGRAVVFATHDREFASVLADRTLRLRAPERPPGEALR